VDPDPNPLGKSGLEVIEAAAAVTASVKKLVRSRLSMATGDKRHAGKRQASPDRSVDRSVHRSSPPAETLLTHPAPGQELVQADEVAAVSAKVSAPSKVSMPPRRGAGGAADSSEDIVSDAAVWGLNKRESMIGMSSVKVSNNSF
jgi:hypothetical protein